MTKTELTYKLNDLLRSELNPYFLKETTTVDPKGIYEDVKTRLEKLKKLEYCLAKYNIHVPLKSLENKEYYL